VFLIANGFREFKIDTQSLKTHIQTFPQIKTKHKSNIKQFNIQLINSTNVHKFLCFLTQLVPYNHYKSHRAILIQSSTSCKPIKHQNPLEIKIKHIQAVIIHN